MTRSVPVPQQILERRRMPDGSWSWIETTAMRTWMELVARNIAAGGGGGVGVNVEDEGVPILTPATTLDFVGAGVTVTNAGGGVAEVDIPGGSGAPVDASYVVMGLDGTLTQERVLAAANPITLTDGGAGGSATIGATLIPPSPGGALPPAGFLPNIGRRRVMWSQAPTTGTGINAASNCQNWNPNISAGTGATNPGIGSHTNLYTSGARVRWPSTATANLQVGAIFQDSLIVRGAAADCGGWVLEGIMGYNQVNANSRFAFGLYGTNALPIASADPSSLTSFIGFGIDAGDTNWQFMHNDAAGTCTKIDLGANYPRPTPAVSLYFFHISQDPNSGNPYYHMQLLNDHTKAPATGSVSTNLPSSTILLYPLTALSTGPTLNVSVHLDFYRMMCVTTL